jgi:hypothetical protein
VIKGKLYFHAKEEVPLVDEESEIFLGIRLTLDELRAMFATKAKDEETESAIVGVDALDLKDEN